MDEDDILGLDPGSFSDAAGQGIGSLSDIDNLQASFTPNLDNLIGSDSSGPSIAQSTQAALSNLGLYNNGSTQAASMDDEQQLANLVSGDLGSGSVNSASGIYSSLGGSLSSLNLNPLISDVGSIGSGLASAFLINPQNAQTQEQETLANAQVSSLLSSQLFGYILIGGVIWLLFSFLSNRS